MFTGLFVWVVRVERVKTCSVSNFCIVFIFYLAKSVHIFSIDISQLVITDMTVDVTYMP